MRNHSSRNMWNHSFNARAHAHARTCEMTQRFHFCLISTAMSIFSSLQHTHVAKKQFKQKFKHICSSWDKCHYRAVQVLMNSIQTWAAITVFHKHLMRQNSSYSSRMVLIVYPWGSKIQSDTAFKNRLLLQPSNMTLACSGLRCVGIVSTRMMRPPVYS